ncbi:NAD(P)-dependent oxidoreductase [Limosilactobacillus sp.]|jgi:putative NADH-flavin reductase|uniref:NAD(P)-dependent oxidoreductase n=1 Tax=Limosilactobacillus sp. TaxID=2773925 RepID=UPI0025BB3C02|nr:NAD(P)H-binding protein [Limosilactobacillus sp.]MCH3922734.1 NAD(P)H-binding protein [Limosilactobacillus sp.]MCH3927417.1 NAD(P)H-binding protein [Limosilactobacillus sp.]
MKIMVIGAFGRVGQKVVRLAQAQGMQVTAVGHHDHPEVDLGQATVLIKDVKELTQKEITGYDAILDATAGWDEDSAANVYLGLWHLAQLLSSFKNQTRLLKVGGTNTLFINPEHTLTLQSLSSYYPAKYKFMCDAHQEALDILRRYSNLLWTYVTPAYNFDSQGVATHSYHVAGEEFTPVPGGDDGKDDYISYTDFAQGIVDLIANHQFIRQRITLSHGDKPVE